MFQYPHEFSGVQRQRTEKLIHHLVHPYPQELMSAVPLISIREKRERTHIQGEVPSAINPPSGCAFHTCCQFKQDICEFQTPELKSTKTFSGENYQVSCHLR